MWTKKLFGETVKMEIIFSKKLAEKLHKLIIRNMGLRSSRYAIYK